MQNTPDVLLPSVPVGTVMDVWQRQSGVSVHRVSGQSHAAQSLQHWARVLHVCRSTIDAIEKNTEFWKLWLYPTEMEQVEAQQKLKSCSIQMIEWGWRLLHMCSNVFLEVCSVCAKLAGCFPPLSTPCTSPSLRDAQTVRRCFLSTQLCLPAFLIGCKLPAASPNEPAVLVLVAACRLRTYTQLMMLCTNLPTGLNSHVWLMGYLTISLLSFQYNCLFPIVSLFASHSTEQLHGYKTLNNIGAKGPTVL